MVEWKYGTAYEYDGLSFELFYTNKLYTQKDHALDLFSKHNISKDFFIFCEGYYEKHRNAEKKTIPQNTFFFPTNGRELARADGLLADMSKFSHL